MCVLLCVLVPLSACVAIVMVVQVVLAFNLRHAAALAAGVPAYPEVVVEDGTSPRKPNELAEMDPRVLVRDRSVSFEIERVPGRTEVIVDEGMNTVSYELNEALIAFGTAVDDGDLHGACAMLERLELTAETEGTPGES